MSIPVGRRGQVYAKVEAAYGTEEILTATEALRHVEVQFGFNPFNRVTSPEKKQSPGPATRLDRKMTAELGSLVALLRPGGALNVEPEIQPILAAGIGASNDVTLSTTVEAAPAPTVTSATVADATGLTVGDAVLINVALETADTPFVRILTAISGEDLTWDPALPSAPASGDTVKAGITYRLTTDLAASLTIGHWLDATKKRILLGAGIDQLTLTFDANEEGRLSASGPAQMQLTQGGQSKPVGFTTVGTNPPSGLSGGLLIDGVPYLFKTLEVAITNTLMVRNQEYGVNAGTEVYRQGRREITFSMEAFAETEATLYDKAESGDYVTYLLQSGKTEGNIVAVYAPKAEFTVPEQDDPDEEVSWTFAGQAIETADGLNDELIVAFL